MLLTIDIGNTQTTNALFDGEEMVARWATTTCSSETPDEVHRTLAAQLSLAGYSLEDVTDVALASVVPALAATMSEVAQRVSGKRPVVVGPGIKSGLPMRYDNPAEIGADRVADAVAAVNIYGAPVIVVDLGTATNIEVIDKDGNFCGGIIAPGLVSSSEALYQHAARLFQVGFSIPDHVIGTNTADAMSSGIMLGEVARIDGLVTRIFDELGYEAPVIATGGLGRHIAPASSTITGYEPNLTLLGLRMIYAKNRG